MTSKGQCWVFHEEVQVQSVGEGFVRRVLSYDDALMCVENSFEKGAVAPLHAHPHIQSAYIVAGVFAFEVDGEVKTVRKGDSIFLKSNVPHACTCLEAGIVLDIFTPMREDFV